MTLDGFENDPGQILRGRSGLFEMADVIHADSRRRRSQ